MSIELLGNLKNPRILVIGVFHGDEPQGDFLVRKYLEKFKDSNLLFVPCLNKYGFEHNVRTNSNGVDLNRNFPTKNWELTEKNEFYGGIFPASEKETRFVIELIEKYQLEIILTLHAPFKIVNYDGAKTECELKLLEEISNIMEYPLEASVGYPTPGSFGTWSGIEKGILTITLELDEEIDVQLLEPKVFKVFELLEGIKNE